MSPTVTRRCGAPSRTCTTTDLHQRYAEHLYAETGFDLRGRTFDHFFATHLVGAAAVEVGGGHMDVTVWRDGASEHVVRKH